MRYNVADSNYHQALTHLGTDFDIKIKYLEKLIGLSMFNLVNNTETQCTCKSILFPCIQVACLEWTNAIHPTFCKVNCSPTVTHILLPIRFVTDYVQKFVVSVKSIEGEAEPGPHTSPENYILSKLVSTLPEDNSRQVLACPSQQFLRKRLLKKYRQILNHS